MEPRETFPEPRPPWTPMRQLQIHLCRLPDFVLQSPAVYLLRQSPQHDDVDRCIAQSHPQLSHLATQPAFSHLSCPITNCLPEMSHPETQPASPLSPHPIRDSPQKSLLLRLQRLPQSVVQSAMHSNKYVSSPPQQHPQSTLHSALIQVSSQQCSHGRPGSEVEHTETHRAKTGTTLSRVVPGPPQTVSAGAELQEDVQDEQEERRLEQAEEDKSDSSVKETVLQNCPTTDPHSVLRSQNPAECTSVNTPTGLTNGFPQKGLSQNTYKIRVDFKVSLSSLFALQLIGLCIYSTVLPFSTTIIAFSQESSFHLKIPT